MATFVEKKSYDRAVNTIVALKQCPFAGVVTGDQVKIALGELLDVWPEAIADDGVTGIE